MAEFIYNEDDYVKHLSDGMQEIKKRFGFTIEDKNLKETQLAYWYVERFLQGFSAYPADLREDAGWCFDVGSLLVLLRTAGDAEVKVYERFVSFDTRGKNQGLGEGTDFKLTVDAGGTAYSVDAEEEDYAGACDLFILKDKHTAWLFSQRNRKDDEGNPIKYKYAKEKVYTADSLADLIEKKMKDNDQPIFFFDGIPLKNENEYINEYGVRRVFLQKEGEKVQLMIHLG